MTTELTNFTLIGGPRDEEQVAVEMLPYGGDRDGNEQMAPPPTILIGGAIYLRTPVPDGDAVAYEYRFEE